MRCYAHINPSDGCYQHRLILPFRYLSQDYPEADFELSLTDPHGQFDYYFLHSLFPSFENFRYVSRWKRGGGRWVWGLDDVLNDVPEWNHAKPSDEKLDVYYHSLDVSDYILCSTPALASAVNRPNKTLVARNLVEVSSYGVTEPALCDEGPLRVLWAGSKTHTLDVEQLVAPIDRLCDKWGGSVEFYFVGFAPGNLLKKRLNSGVKYITGVPLAHYPHLLRSIRPHIELAPLVDIPFNRAKSNIRVLEAWSLAAATVASPVGEYAVVRDGTDGLHATTEDEWFDRIDRLIADPDLRLGLGRAGRARVSEIGDWANPDCRGEWRAVFRRLAESRGERAPASDTAPAPTPK